MKRWKILTIGLALFVSAGLLAAPASSQTPGQISGQVVAEIDPFLVLRTVARIDPDGFMSILEAVLPELLAELSQVQIGSITVNLAGLAGQVGDRLLCIGDPEAIIDRLEAEPLGSLVRGYLADFLVLDTGMILALIPDLPAEVQDLLWRLLPSEIDLNHMPLAGAWVTVLNSRNMAIGFAMTGLEGQYSLRLPNGAAALRITRTGYQTRVIPLVEALEDGGKLVLAPNGGRLTGMVSGPRQRPFAGGGAEVVVETATGQPSGVASRFGLYSIQGIEPLLPGLMGGIGLHRIEIDVEGYNLERHNVLFLASNAIKSVQLTQADPFGTLTGQVVGRTRPILQLENWAVDQLFGRPPLANVQVTVHAGEGEYEQVTDQCGRYRIEGLPVGQDYVASFARTSPTVNATEDEIEIRAARETELNVCVANGGLSGLVRRGNSVVLGGDVRIFNRGTTTGAVRTTGIVAGFYSFGDNIPLGTYDIQFRRVSGFSLTNMGWVYDYEIKPCEDTTLNQDF